MDKMMKLVKQITDIPFVRYLIIGGINTVVSLIVFNAFLFILQNDHSITRTIVMVPAQFTGILVSYILNSMLTFKRKLSIKGFIAFAGPLAMLQLVVGVGGMYVLSLQGLDKNISFILITMINVVLGYTITKMTLNKFTEEA